MLKKVNLFFVSITTLCVFTGYALDIAVDATKTHQVVHGLGTCVYTWRENPNPYDLLTDPAYQERYAVDLGADVLRLPVSPDILWENNNEIPYQDIALKMDFEAGRVRWKWNKEGDKVWYTFDQISWSRTDGPLKFARAVSQLNPDMKVIGTVWAPPSYMKHPNTRPSTVNPIRMSIQGDEIDLAYKTHFGKFLVEWVKGVKEKYGIDIYALSIQNEPLFRQSYDSCQYPTDGKKYKEVFDAVVAEFEKAGVPMKFFGAEDMTKFPSRAAGYTEPLANDPNSLKHLQAFATHGYSDGVISDNDPDKHEEYWNLIKDYGKENWMTETGAGTWDWGTGVGGCLSQTGGSLHNMFTRGNISLITFWQCAVHEHGSGHGMMYMNEPSKKFYVFKHFSAHIQPGSERIDVTPHTSNNVQVSAFLHPESKKLTIVVINYDGSNKRINLNLTGYTSSRSLLAYQTTGNTNHEEIQAVPINNGTASITVGRSITTLVSEAPPTDPVQIVQEPVNLSGQRAVPTLNTVVAPNGRIISRSLLAEGVLAKSIYLHTSPTSEKITIVK